MTEGLHVPGVKDDSSKMRPTLLPVAALEAALEVLEYGAKKYSKNGWRSVPNARERYTDALVRHLWEYLKNPMSVDPESGILNVRHMLCNAIFLNALDTK